MQNIYPMFERNRILKKELLWSLRDYSFAHIQLEYQDYGRGLLRGCKIDVQNGNLVVGPGIIKYGNFIILITEEMRISYTPADQVQYLKIKMESDYSSLDYVAYKVELFMDTQGCQGENEIELCRFHLRKGACLRASYTNFTDLATEYDTINLIHANWGGLGGSTISPAITRYFAEILLCSENSQPEDRMFAYLCLSQPGAVPVSVLSNYIEQKTGSWSSASMNSQDIYEAMCAIIKMVRIGGGKSIKNVKEKHRILVD